MILLYHVDYLYLKSQTLFFKLEKYKEFDYVLSITDSGYNKPASLNINLKNIKGEYFLD